MSEKPKILLVDDEAENLRALERTLRVSFDVTLSASPQDALEKLRSEEFAVIVSDQRMPGMPGTEFLAEASKICPITTRLILTAFTDSKEILSAINRAEIYRYVTKPWDNADLISTLRQAVERFQLQKENLHLVEELRRANHSLESQVAARTKELELANLKLAELAMTDPLTRTSNRRALQARFQDEIDRAERYSRALTVAMVDVDHFKDFNDMEGHLCGDEALKKVAATLMSCLRKTDFLVRYGGEEFLILMPETPVSHGLEIATRLRSAVEGTLFQGRTKTAYLTISIGVSGFPRHGQSPKVLIDAADQALFAAKQTGRNKIVVAS